MIMTYPTVLGLYQKPFATEKKYKAPFATEKKLPIIESM